MVGDKGWKGVVEEGRKEVEDKGWKEMEGDGR